MADENASAQQLTQISEVKTFDPDVSRENLRAFLDEIINAIKDSGELIEGEQVYFPGRNERLSVNPSHQEQRNQIENNLQQKELYYSDVVQMLADSVRWLRANGSDDTKKSLGNYLEFLEIDKYALIKQWAGIGSEISEDELIKNRHWLAQLLREISQFAAIEFKDQVKSSNDEEIRDEEEVASTSIQEESDPEAIIGRRQDQPDENLEADAAVVPQTEIPPDEPQETERQHRQRIQYEATWIYNRALHDLFISNGISYEYLETHPEVKLLLIEEVMSLLQKRNPAELELLFANPVKRLQVLDELYREISQSSKFVATLNNFYEAYAISPALSDQERQDFSQKIPNLPAQSEENILHSGAAKLIKSDSPALLSSIQLAVDSLIFERSISFDYIEEGSDNSFSTQKYAPRAHDAIWMLENMSDQHLLLMLQISEKLSPEKIEELRRLVVRYAKLKALQLAMKADSFEFAQGLDPISEEDAQQILANNSQYISKRFLTTGSGIRETVKKHGVDKVAAALTTDLEKQKERERRILSNLPERQREYLIKYFNITEDQLGEYAVHFGLEELQKTASVFVKEEDAIRRKQLANEILQDELLQQLAIEQDQIRRSQELAQQIKLLYLQQSTQQQIAYMMQAAEAQSQQELINKLSFLQMTSLESTAPEGSIEDPQSLGGRMRQALSSGPLGKIPSPKDKALNSLKQAAGGKLAKSKAISKLLSKGGIYGKAAAILVDPKKRKAGAGIALFSLLGIMRMFQSTGAAVGGAIGGVVGGAIGFAIGGIPGAIIGAGLGAGAGGHIGHTFFGGQGLRTLTSNSFTGSASPQTPFTQTSSSSGVSHTTSSVPQSSIATSDPTIAATGGTFTPVATTTAAATGLGAAITGLPVAILASIGSMMLIALSSLMVLFVIQGSFLITLPSSSENAFSDYLDNFEGCWPTTGTIFAYETYPSGGEHSKSPSGTAIDISTWGNSADDGGVNPPIYTPYSGIATFYPDGTGSTGYGNYVKVETGAFTLIFGHMLALPDSSVSFQNADTGELITISPTQVTRNVSVRAGNFIGTVNDTGTSDGNHLHYEIISNDLDIIDIIPITEAERQAAINDETSLRGIPANSAECARTNIDSENSIEGYVAIGPKTADNLVVTDSSIVQSPIQPCVWHQSNPDLNVVVNANYYNSVTVPIGPAGSNPARYYANANNRPYGYMGVTGRYLGVNNSGGVEFGPVPEAWYGATNMPFDLTNLSKAISGVTSEVIDDGEMAPRTAIGTGRVSRECTNFAGDAFIIGAIRWGTVSDLAGLMRECGAEQFMFLDAGASASFCSADLEINGSRVMPVSAGLRSAEVESVYTSVSRPGSDDDDNNPLPTSDPGDPIPQ